ncbi:hypothetical protein LIG30_3488 [Burkholderia sp. lig30]|jgi:hypothetical protein|uniref:hypothetical protein n=1 Tax=Burkholderia sp. lig30 TaxID=1192124 RepID=UPI000460CECB|nr:hypothetical protein [Burkholderia sp. lig30]KDB07242.1 hypothetical protein LIG30_3488 [Burkholderia sp. lig30]
MSVLELEKLAVKGWPFLVGALAFVTAVLTAFGAWLTIRKNRAEIRKLALETEEKARLKSTAEETAKSDEKALEFVNVKIADNNDDWAENDGVRFPCLYHENTKLAMSKFSRMQYFSIKNGLSDSTPSFDVLLHNIRERDLTILAVGVRVVYVAHFSYQILGYAGDLPEARKLPMNETYVIEMPKIGVSDVELDEDGDGGEAVNVLVKASCEPYVLEAGAYFRYRILLNNWWGRMPTNAILRLWVLTGTGERESHELYVRYGDA